LYSQGIIIITITIIGTSGIARGTMNAILKYVLLFYFVTHIPATLCIDLQALLGTFYPPALKDLLSWYIATYKDPLMSSQPVWFKALIVLEIPQFIFFFVAIYALLTNGNWIRIPAIIYGSHVATAVFVILSEMMLSTGLDMMEKAILFGFYFPYFLIPFVLMIYMAATPMPFRGKSKTS
jgi:hypothetical protein